MITLKLKDQPTVPLEAECIAPDVLAPLAHAAIRALPVFHGKRRCRLDDFFDVAGEASAEVHVSGDLSKVKWLGKGMTRGRVTVNGNVGMHLGAHMAGGAIEVTGNASDWVGAEMRGGSIRVRGHAGGQVGAAYRGSLAGMNKGTIVIDGTAGLEVGMRMKRGTIVIGGRVRDFAGLQMKGGTIVLLQGAEIRTGAWMIRGTIISFTPLQLLPTFAHSCTYSPVALPLIWRHLRGLGVALPGHVEHASYERYMGDAAVPGRGEILVLHDSM